MGFKNNKQRAAFFAMKKAKEEGKILNAKPVDPLKKVDDLINENAPKLKKPEVPNSFSKIKNLLKKKVKR